MAQEAARAMSTSAPSDLAGILAFASLGGAQGTSGMCEGRRREAGVQGRLELAAGCGGDVRSLRVVPDVLRGFVRTANMVGDGRNWGLWVRLQGVWE